MPMTVTINGSRGASMEQALSADTKVRAISNRMDKEKRIGTGILEIPSNVRVSPSSRWGCVGQGRFLSMSICINLE